MLYRYLGQSGLLVSRICLGTMTFGMKDWGCDQKTANAIVRHFIDQGGQFIDTADMYSAGLSEEMLGNAIKNHHREDLVVASKCWFRTGEGTNNKGLSRKHIFDAVEKKVLNPCHFERREKSCILFTHKRHDFEEVDRKRH